MTELNTNKNQPKFTDMSNERRNSLSEVFNLAWQFVKRNSFTLSEALETAWDNIKLKASLMPETKGAEGKRQPSGCNLPSKYTPGRDAVKITPYLRKGPRLPENFKNR